MLVVPIVIMRLSLRWVINRMTIPLWGNLILCTMTCIVWYVWESTTCSVEATASVWWVELIKAKEILLVMLPILNVQLAGMKMVWNMTTTLIRRKSGIRIQRAKEAAVAVVMIKG